MHPWVHGGVRQGWHGDFWRHLLGLRPHFLPKLMLSPSRHIPVAGDSFCLGPIFWGPLGFGFVWLCPLLCSEVGATPLYFFSAGGMRKAEEQWAKGNLEIGVKCG